jgi:hypothetical protein
VTYWRWFLQGSGGRPGYRSVISAWLVLHVAAGAILAWSVDLSLERSASTVLIPLVSVLVGLSFAWGGNAVGLLQTKGVRDLTSQHPGRLPEYAFIFQTAILVVLVALVVWGVAGLGVFDARWPTSARGKSYAVLETLLYAIASLTVREAWHVAFGTQALLVGAWRTTEKSDS